MKKKVCKKFIEYLITFCCIITLNFIIPRLMPGDPFTFLSSEEGNVTVNYSEEQIEKYKEYYGLNNSMPEQYKDYIVSMLNGNIGYSIYFNEDVLKLIISRAVWTIPIVLISIIFSCLIGVFLGGLSAWYNNGYIDKVLYFIMIVFSEIPAFLIGVLCLFILAAKLNLFPLSGAVTVFATYDSYFSQIKDIVYHAFLPVLTLVLSTVGGFYLLSRNSMISVLSKDYIRII
ncbi:MAG: ABC transporter permease [Clostridium sp.]|uniref:ABC transporter permease n=1 Tax=Clostridium sp. TaxID=1506 RepID=UPI003D6C7C0E